MAAPVPADRVRGCLFGLAAGDALGAPCRGMTAAEVFRQFGLLDARLAAGSGEPLRVTNNTLQALAVAGHLAARDAVDGVELVCELAAAFDAERKHDARTRAVLDAARQGGDWRAARSAAMNDAADAAVRVAAVGLAFAGDLDRVWEEARAAARVTHADPLPVEGAQLFAGAVALTVNGVFTDRREFLTELCERARADEYRWALRTAARLKRSDSVAVLGSEPAAARSVVTAIACFAATPGDFTLAVGRAVGLGGAADYLGAMTGALCGVAGDLPNTLAGWLEPLPTQDVADRLAGRQPK